MPLKKKNIKTVICITDQDELKDLVKSTFPSSETTPKVYFASTGEEGIELARKYKPDVVLMDQIMHQLSGIDAAREIRHEMPTTKIVMMTMYLCDSSPTGV